MHHFFIGKKLLVFAIAQCQYFGCFADAFIWVLRRCYPPQYLKKKKGEEQYFFHILLIMNVLFGLERPTPAGNAVFYYDFG